MTPSEEARKRTAWMLEELGKQNENNKSDEWYYEFHKEDAYGQKTALEVLQRDGAITMLKIEKLLGFLSVDGTDALTKVPGAATFKVVHPKFEGIYSEFVGRPFGRPASKISIVIHKKRGIRRADGVGKTYEIRGKRMKTIHLLLDGPKRTKNIKAATPSMKNNSAVRHQIDAINAVADKNLILNGIELIEHVDTVGYFFNDRDLEIRVEG
ncbi:MAG: hypothetical protein ACYC48_01515 [Minisyncoccota bacterium]